MAVIPRKWVVLILLVMTITGQSNHAASRDIDIIDITASGYRYHYDGNYVLPAVEGSSYPTGYTRQFYFIPGYNLGHNQASTLDPASINPVPLSPAPLSAAYFRDNFGRQKKFFRQKDANTTSTPDQVSADNGADFRTMASLPASGYQSAQISQSAGDTDHKPQKKHWQPLWGFLSEIRLGAGRHDTAVVGRRKERGIDLDAELLLASPDMLAYIWSPRPTLGIHANLENKNNTSQVYGGLTWEWWPLEPVFINFFFGMSYHNGKTETENPKIKSLGSLWLFRESLSIGWQTTDHFNISAYIDHASNGTLLGKSNEGMDTLGVRLGYRF